MLCPSLGTRREYCEWITNAGLRIHTAEDITTSVSRTWDKCRAIAGRPAVRKLLRSAESDVVAFVKSFADIAAAYASGAMAYGMFTATKDTEPE
jgi:hypothetical protein